MKLNTTAIQTAVYAFLSHGDGFEQACTDVARLFKGADRETVKATVCPMVSAYYTAKGSKDCAFVEGQWEHPMCAAKTKANRLLRTIVGTAKKTPATSAKTLPNLTRAQKAAIAALLAAFNGDAKAAKAAI